METVGLTGRLTVVTVIGVLLAAGLPAVNAGHTTVDGRHPMNDRPSAQAGAPAIVLDGGPNDGDDEVDGDANVQITGHRSSDPNGQDLGSDQTRCQHIQFTFPGDDPLHYEWYEGPKRTGTPIATGKTPTLFGHELGFVEYTLQVHDDCGATDSDHMQAFVGTSQTELARWTFTDDLGPAWTTTGIADTTNTCNVAADGAYLAFNLGVNDTGACSYRSDEPVQGTATLEADPGSADVLALEFSTRFDTREGVGTLNEELFGNVPEDLLTVQASFDGGDTWTQANHTFSYDRMDADLDADWHRAGGIYNLSDREVTADQVLFRFTFDSVTAPSGGGYGWLVDDVRLTSLSR